MERNLLFSASQRWKSWNKLCTGWDGSAVIMSAYLMSRQYLFSKWVRTWQYQALTVLFSLFFPHFVAGPHHTVMDVQRTDWIIADWNSEASWTFSAGTAHHRGCSTLHLFANPWWVQWPSFADITVLPDGSCEVQSFLYREKNKGERAHLCWFYRFWMWFSPAFGSVRKFVIHRQFGVQDYCY